MLVQYKGKLSTVWKLAKVDKVFTDKHGVVRTCEVMFRPVHKGEKPLSYQAKPLYSLRIAIQRLRVLLPVEEQTGGVADEAEEDVLDHGPDECHVLDGEDKCIVPVTAPANTERDELDEEVRFNFEEGNPNEEVNRPTKLSRQEKLKQAKEKRQPRRFSRHLAGFSAAVKVALDLGFYLSSEDEEDEGV